MLTWALIALTSLTWGANPRGSDRHPAAAFSESVDSLPAPAKPSFKTCFENVLKENYDSMLRQMDELITNNVLDIGNPSGLSRDERVAVLSYTYSTYDTVNSILRERQDARQSSKTADDVEAIAPYVEVLNAALDKLPPYKGTVLRTTSSMPSKILAEHQVGSTVTYPAYTSTSMERRLGAKYNFTIRSETGADLGGYASNTNEQEVLFKPGTRFRITKREKKNGNTYIEMEEAP